MSELSTANETLPALLQALLRLLEAHRGAFRQQRCFHRALALVFGELFVFARHTLSQGLMALGVVDRDWSAWYRLFSRARYDEGVMRHCLLLETLRHVKGEEDYVTAIDTTHIGRCSLKMPGTGWARSARTAPFRRGLERAQRFLQGAWLPKIEQGYSRAIPLAFLPAFTKKAVPAGVESLKEWAAGLEFINWLREELDACGRFGQRLVVLADGAYDTIEFWRGLARHTVAIIRTARNRHLRELPPAYSGRGRRRKYGEQARQPAQWLREREGWQEVQVEVRGRKLRMRYRLCGPYLRERASDVPLFLLVVGGASYLAGKKEPRKAQRRAAFYLVNAVAVQGEWRLPLAEAEILSLVWQRWELEVAHRQMKSALGVGDKQCWNPRSAVVSVQWGAWVYAVLLLSGYRTWGWLGGPRNPASWWQGARRWSFNTLWRSYRAALWGKSEFRALWPSTPDNWHKKDTWLAGLGNAVAGAARI